MALVIKDRIKETATTTGTGTFTLGGAVSGFQAFSEIGDGNTTYYCIEHATEDEFEVGLGTYTLSGTTLARTTIITSSNAGNAVNFSAGDKNVFVTVPATKTIKKDASDSANITSSDVTSALGFTPISSADGGDAATLDSLDSTSFLRSDADDSVTGVITFPLTGFKISDQVTVSHSTDQTYKTLTIKNEGDDNEASIDGLSSDGTRQFMVYGGAQSQGFLHPVNYSWRLKIPLTGSLSRDNAYTIWDSGNDGSGSGLDADTVDGIQASSFLRSNADDTTTGNISIIKNAPKLILDSSSSGSNTDEQSATISLGESGTGSASLHLSYTGDGYSYIGMGSLGADNIPDYRAMRLYYTNDNVHFYDSLTCAGNITAYSSDRRLKENIQTIDNAMDMVGRLRGVTFDWKDGLEDLGFSPDMKTEIGLIAQELQEVIPDAVVPAPFDHDESGSISGKNYLTVKPEKVIPVLIEAIKELNTKIDMLKE